MSGALLVRDVAISFGGVRAVDGVSLDAPAGQITSLIGPNGAGKSTLLNVISGIYQAERGEVWFGSAELTRLRTHEVARCGVARTFQNVGLFREMTVLDNLLTAQHLRIGTSLPSMLLGLPSAWKDQGEARGRALDSLAALEVAHLARRIAGDLPLGLQKRVELARALCSNPQLLLLDEPSSGMNTREKADMADVIAQLPDRFGATILLVEHDMDLVMSISDRVCVLDFGRKLVEGDPASVRNNPHVIEAYLGTEV